MVKHDVQFVELFVKDLKRLTAKFFAMIAIKNIGYKNGCIVF